MPRKQALLDTNILQYSYDSKFSASTTEFLQSVNEVYEIATTSYTKFELFRGLSGTRVTKVKAMYDGFSQIDVAEDVYRIAAAISTCYSKDEATKKFTGRYSDGDIMMAATAFASGAHIITANMNDFPRPYFIEVDQWQRSLSSTAGAYVRVAILKPDFVYFNSMIKQLYPVALQETDL